MSSRSFRRRNNRRRRRPGGEGEERRPEGAAEERGTGGQESRPAAQGGSPQAPENRGGRGGAQRADADQRRGGQRRGGRKGGQGRASEEQPPRPSVPVVVPDCPVCGKPVRELASALTHRASKQPAHFDCIVQELKESNEIAPQEKLCYLGGGCFGILEFRPPGGPSKFVIKRRIQYEEKETPQEWKKPLQVSC